MNRYATIPNQRSHMNGGIFILILMALILLVYAVIQVTLWSHGYLAHGPEAEQTRNCIHQNGVWKAYREPNSSTLKTKDLYKKGTYERTIGKSLQKRI